MNRKQFFDHHAEAWDRRIKPDFLARVRGKVMPGLGLKKGDAVLDVGSGTGILLPMIRKAVGPGARVDALDYSPKMLEKARLNHGDGFGYIRANAERAPSPSGRYDVAVCFSVFPHFVKKVAVLKEMRRVLKKGGRIVVVHADTAENINKHHHHVGGPVARDFMPGWTRMKVLLARSGFVNPVLDERPGLYVACATKG